MKKSKTNITGWLKENSNVEITRRAEKMFQLATRILEIMVQKGMNRVQLADKMGKRPSEISKILSGSHNITINSLFAIEEALDGEEIFNVTKSNSDSEKDKKFVYLHIHHFEKNAETQYTETKIPPLPENMQIMVN